QGTGDGDAVVPVADEVVVPQLVDVDRRDLLADAAGTGDALPPRAALVGGGPEAAVEVLHLVDRADDRVERDQLQPEASLAASAEGVDDLVERQRPRGFTALAAQAGGQRRQRLQATRPHEV